MKYAVWKGWLDDFDEAQIFVRKPTPDIFLRMRKEAWFPSGLGAVFGEHR